MWRKKRRASFDHWHHTNSKEKISSKEKCDITNWGTRKASARSNTDWLSVPIVREMDLNSSGSTVRGKCWSYLGNGTMCLWLHLSERAMSILGFGKKYACGFYVQKDRWDDLLPLTTEYSKRIRKKLTFTEISKVERKITMFISGHSLQSFAGDRPSESIHLRSVLSKQKMKQKSQCDSEWFQATCKGMRSTWGHQLGNPHNSRCSF